MTHLHPVRKHYCRVPNPTSKTFSVTSPVMSEVLGIVSCGLYWRLCLVVYTGDCVLWFILEILFCGSYRRLFLVVYTGDCVLWFTLEIVSCGPYRRLCLVVHIGDCVLWFLSIFLRFPSIIDTPDYICPDQHQTSPTSALWVHVYSCFFPRPQLRHSAGEIYY